MNDRDCIALLQWALPQIGHRWQGYRRVRRQVCRRIAARMQSLGIADAAAYRRHLETNSTEWSALRTCLRVTISRFFRDRGVFQRLADTVLPALAQSLRQQGEHTLRVWSVGCASGEEPYSLSLLWALELQAHHPDLTLSIRATDADATVLERAKAACYPASSLREIPGAWRDRAFTRDGARYCLRPTLRRCVDFWREDVCITLPDGPFHLILCRNLAFTYFDLPLQERIAAELIQRLAPGGYLILGAHEHLPDGMESALTRLTNECIYSKASSARAANPASATAAHGSHT